MATKIKYKFGEYLVSFCFYNDDIDGIAIGLFDSINLLFCIEYMTITIYKFSDTMQFFGLSNSLDDFSEVQIDICQRYPFKTFDELTGYKVTDKLKELINAIKLEDKIDTNSQIIYELIKSLFSEQYESIKLVFVD
jgi:hypothetical protein